MIFRFLKSLRQKLLNMSQEEATAIPPPAVRGMTILDRNAFRKKVSFPALAVPVQFIKPCKKILRTKLPSLQMKFVVNHLSKEQKLILLNPGFRFDADEKQSIESLGIKAELTRHELEIGYEHFKARDIFKAILPATEGISEDSTSPKGYSQVGHIVHLNLREHQLPYKKIIGQVFLDKVPTARTVVHKVNTINSEFRNFQMELLAGEDDFVARVVEHNRIFEFDFSKVFWNPRLSTEHNRITALIPGDDVVFDVFAGVGPFAVPLARKGCKVFANDLNPDSYRWLQQNAKLNKAKTLETFNLDGRAFIKTVLRVHLLKLDKSCTCGVHVLMNLPAIAVEFLDAFNGLLADNVALPDITVHLYMFAVEEGDIKPRAIKHLGDPLPSNCSIHLVRNVAPSKDMFCLSFSLSSQVLCKKSADIGTDEAEPNCKRLKAS